MRRFALLSLLTLSCAGLASGADYSTVSTPVRFHSPKGQFEFSFQPQQKRLYSMSQERHVPAGTKSQIYSVSFYLPGQTAPAALTYYTDIEHSGGPFPTPLATLADHLLWSPNEDFAVLPTEHWPAQLGEIIPRQAVSTRTSYSWQFADFHLLNEPLIWLDSLHVIGNVTEGCRREVREFDGDSGRTSSYQNADPPQGYEILSHDESTVVLKKVLGDCATDTDRNNFRPECLRMNVSFGRREIGACPP